LTKIQILSAMITYALLLIHRVASCFKGSLWMFLFELRLTLLNRPQTQAKMRRRREQLQQEIALIQLKLFA